MKHIFYTGARGVGKSTLVREAFREAGICPAGFVTRKLGDRVVMQAPAEGWAGAVANEEAVIAHCGALPGSGQLVPGAMAGIAARLLAAGPQKPLVMDELGYMECGDEAFCGLVLKALDERAGCIGVLREGDDPFLAAVAARPDVMVRLVTPGNREHLRMELARWLAQRYAGRYL